MSDIRKVLDIDPKVLDNPDAQIISLEQDEDEQFIINDIKSEAQLKYAVSQIKCQLAPNSDFVSQLLISTPFTGRQTDDVQQYIQQTIQQLRVGPYPGITEMEYYLFILDKTDVSLKYSYMQVMEIVELAEKYENNFTLVADRLKSASLDAIQCLEAFGLYSHLIQQKVSEGTMPQTVQHKRSLELLAAFNTSLMGEQMVSQKLIEEYNNQCNYAETELCFSPLRLISERFQHMNANLNIHELNQTILKEQQGDVDFSNFVLNHTKSIPKQQSPVAGAQHARINVSGTQRGLNLHSNVQSNVGVAQQAQQKAWQHNSIGLPQNQQLPNNQHQNTDQIIDVYKQELLKNTEILPTISQLAIQQQYQNQQKSAQQQQSTQQYDTDMLLENRLKNAQQKITFQTIYSRQPGPEQLKQVMQAFKLNEEQISLYLSGCSQQQDEISLIPVVPGRLALKTGLDSVPADFPGHYEIDFDDTSLSNYCTNSALRYQVDEDTLNETADYNQIKGQHQEIKKQEQREFKGQYEYLQGLRKELKSCQIDLKQFFTLEKKFATWSQK